MRLLAVVLAMTPWVSLAKQACSGSETVELEDVVHTVDAKLPKHLKGAKITVTLANGKSSTVPAEKFMVVPRKQTLVAGQNKVVKRSLTCKDSKRNILMGEVRKDIVDLETSTNAIPNGQQAHVQSRSGLVPGVNYYRREVLDTPVGLGVGIDTNGTVKGLVGIDF